MITHFENEAGVQRLTLQRSEDPSEGALTLVFEASPIQLKKWSVMDAQGTTTTVSLLGPTFGKKLDDSLFVVENPSMQRKDN
jgi:outer membrane lipoprotein-sorting protein